MAETKVCPKCSGSMTRGKIMKFNEFSLGKYLYVFAPDSETGLSGNERKPLVAFCCEQCGFTEFYSIAR